MKHRADIDGLRALSVLLVVFYHADLLECHSGYVGVDVFFVISGYLVSQLILRDLDRGEFSLATFFARRIRRLLPCLLVVCLVTTGLGWFFMLPVDFQHLGTILMSQPFLAANLVYAKTTKFGYFGSTTVNYPLLHLWSLAVEEQFYVLFPLFLLYLVPRTRRLAAFAALFLASYALSAWVTASRPDFSYYLLPTRAFEILAGALAGQMVWRGALWFGELASWLAAIVIMLCGWLIPNGTPYPGTVALWPTLAAAVLLSLGAQRPSTLHRLLAWRPLAFIGLVSYSMYLWHWPFIALLRSSQLWKPHYGTYWCILLVPISYVSWRTIEQPLRRRSLTNKQSFGLAAASGLLLAGLGLLIWWNQGFPGRLPESARRLAAQEYTPNPYNREITLEKLQAGELHHFGMAGKTRLMLIGDSHTMAILPGLDEACKKAGISGLAIARSSTPPVYCVIRNTPGLSGQALRDFLAASQRKIDQENPEAVVLVGAWVGYQYQDGFAEGLAETIRACAAHGRRCFVMGQIPNVERKVPRALAYATWLHAPSQVAMPMEVQRKRNLDLQSSLANLPVTYIDPLPFFEGSQGSVAVERDGLALYRDEGHLSVDASRLFAPFLLRQLGLDGSSRPSLPKAR
ncbi:hypothetical protein ABS71_14355 [bacterium SCN 62-11]|nr:acyltransferase [Candidatus Eremiobacteraeota bacterium]ODT63402.1 MAG: hypothetical protein ABS71_14355 [bacterium SCN 62-11]